MSDMLSDDDHERNRVMVGQVLAEMTDAMFHVKRALEQLQSRALLGNLGVSRDAKRYSAVHLAVLRTLSVLGGSSGAMTDAAHHLMNAVILARGEGSIDRSHRLPPRPESVDDTHA